MMAESFSDRRGEFVTVRELLERTGSLPPRTESPEAIRLEQRRAEQIMRCAQAVARLLGDERIEASVLSGKSVAQATRGGTEMFLARFELLDGRLQLEVPIGSAELLFHRWIDRMKLLPEVQIAPLLGFAFLAARLLALHALPSRFGVRLLGVASEGEPRRWAGYHQFEIQLQRSDGELSVEPWFVAFDDPVGLRLDWYAERDEAVAVRSDRVQRILSWRGEQRE